MISATRPRHPATILDPIFVSVDVDAAVAALRLANERHARAVYEVAFERPSRDPYGALAAEKPPA